MKLNLPVCFNEKPLPTLLNEELRRITTIMSTNSLTSYKKVVILSDIYSVRLIKNYMAITNIRIKIIHNPKEFLQYLNVSTILLLPIIRAIYRMMEKGVFSLILSSLIKSLKWCINLRILML